MVDSKRKKETICASVSPYIKKQVDDLVKSGDFASMSDLVSIAVAEFVSKYNAEKQENEKKKSELSNTFTQRVIVE